jgi:hypothetical protein
MCRDVILLLISKLESMSKVFRARCTVLEGGYVNPDLVEIYNVEDPTECYFTGRNQFRINQVLTPDDFYLVAQPYGDEEWLIAYRK